MLPLSPTPLSARKIGLPAWILTILLVLGAAQPTGGTTMRHSDSFLSDEHLWRRIERIARGEVRAGSGSDLLTPEEVQRALQEPVLRLQDSPGLVVLGYRIIAQPAHAQAQFHFCRCLLERRYHAVAAADPYWSNYPARFHPRPREMIEVAVMPTGAPMGYAKEDVFCSVGVFGSTRSGKTEFLKPQIVQLVRFDHCVVAFDRKDDYRRLALLPELRDRTTVLGLDDLALCLYQPADKVPPQVWLGEVNKVFAGCYARLAAHRLLGDVVASLLEAMPPGRYPALSEIIAALEAFRPGPGRREAEYRESLLAVLKDLRRATNRVFDCSHSNIMDRMCAQSGLYVIEVGTLPAEHYLFLATFMLRWIYTQRLYGSQDDLTPFVAALDDVTTAIVQQRDWDAPGGISPLVDQAFMQARFRMGMLLGAHTLEVSEALLRNVGTKFLLRLDGEKPETIRRLWNATEEQADRACRLGRGEVVGLIPPISGRPLFGRFWPLPLPGQLDEAERAASAKRFLAGVEVHPPSGLSVHRKTSQRPAAGQPQAAADGSRGISVSEGALALLKQAATGLPCTKTRLYEKTGITRAEGRIRAKQLEDAGLVRIHRFTTGRQGGAVEFLEPTARAWQLLAAYDLKMPPALVGGGWEHEAAARLIHAAGRRRKMRVRCEVRVGEVRLDLEWRDHEGRAMYFNIGISDPSREAANALKALRLPALQENTLTLVCRDVEFARKVREQLDELDGNGESARKIRLALLTDYLDE